MPIIDDEGRLFGLINVVDALVVLLALAVALAGVALVVSDGEPAVDSEPETRYVTLDVGTQPDYVLNKLEVGDTTTRYDSVENFTITDTYLSPSRSGTKALVRVMITTRSTGNTFTVDGEPLRLGRSLEFTTDSYSLKGTIVQDGTSDFGLGNETVLVTDAVNAGVANQLTEGAAFQVAGETISTIESFTVYGTDNPDLKRIYVGLSVQTLESDTAPKLRPNRTLRDGAVIPFRTASYEFEGEVVQVGTLTQPGQPTDRTVTLEMQNVSPERAASVKAGQTETNAGQTVARILDVEVEPAATTVTSDSGQIYERDHPINKTVTLSVELSVRELDTGVRFKGRTLQEGNKVILDLGTTTIRATVVELDGE